MKLTNESNSKILGIIGGQHSCSIAYIENNEIKVVLEEERLIRQKPYSVFSLKLINAETSSVNIKVMNSPFIKGF